MLNKKGISPLIATVLIIGFTIIIAVLVITWVNNLVGDQTDVQQCQAEAGAKCSDYYNLLTFAAQYSDEEPDDAELEVLAKVTNAAADDPEIVITFMYEDGTLVGTQTVNTYTDGIGSIYYEPGYEQNPQANMVVKFLVKSSSEYKGEPCEVACGEGTEHPVEGTAT